MPCSVLSVHKLRERVLLRTILVLVGIIGVGVVMWLVFNVLGDWMPKDRSKAEDDLARAGSLGSWDVGHLPQRRRLTAPLEVDPCGCRRATRRGNLSMTRLGPSNATRSNALHRRARRLPR